MHHYGIRKNLQSDYTANSDEIKASHQNSGIDYNAQSKGYDPGSYTGERPPSPRHPFHHPIRNALETPSSSEPSKISPDIGVTLIRRVAKIPPGYPRLEGGMSGRGKGPYDAERERALEASKSEGERLKELKKGKTISNIYNPMKNREQNNIKHLWNGGQKHIARTIEKDWLNFESKVGNWKRIGYEEQIVQLREWKNSADSSPFQKEFANAVLDKLHPQDDD